MFTLNWTGLTGSLSLFGGLNPSTGSLWLTDVAHHHLAVAVTFLVAGHLYRTQFSVGTRLVFTGVTLSDVRQHLACPTGNQSRVPGYGVDHHRTPADSIPRLPIPRPRWSISTIPLYSSRLDWWVNGLVLDLRGGSRTGSSWDWSLPGLERLLAHRHSVVVHLNWVSIFLGFHAFGMYIHNDTVLALGRQSDQFGD